MAKKPVKTDEKGYRKFGIRDCVAYAAGDLGCNMSFSLKGTVQTFWLVFMMLETGLLSALLLLVQIWDAINDPIIGSMIDADRRKYKLGKFKTYILVGAVALTVAGACVFLPFPNATVWVKAMLFIIGYVIWDAAYTIANVPYGSMLSLVTEDAGERSQLSTWRSIGSMIGNILPSVILPMLIWKKVFDENGNPVINPDTGVQVEELLGERVFIAALIMGVFGLLCFLFMIKRITIRVDENSVKTNDNEKFSVIKAFGNFMKNRPAVGATVAAMAMFLGMNSATTATTIMFTTYFGMASLSGVVMLIGFVPMFFFMPFIKKIVGKFGKQEAAAGGAFVSCIGGIAMFFFPLVNDKMVALVVSMIALVIFGLGMGIYTCVSWAFMADAIDYNEWKTGKREEGTVYSLHSFFRKLAQGVGPALALTIMQTMGYVNNSKPNAAGEFTAIDVTLFSWDFAVQVRGLVAALYMVAGVMMFIGLGLVYNLGKKKLAQMNEELEARRGVSAE